MTSGFKPALLNLRLEAGFWIEKHIQSNARVQRSKAEHVDLRGQYCENLARKRVIRVKPREESEEEL